MSAYMLISHKGHTDTIQVYSVTVMTHVKALQAGHSSQGTSEPITPASICVVFEAHTHELMVLYSLSDLNPRLGEGVLNCMYIFVGRSPCPI